MQEIQILADEGNTSIKGRFYEDLMNQVFKSQRYIVQGNVNFTGMEFDLLMAHKDRTNETVLVECKVKDSLSADEITKFAFNVGFKKKAFGYFLYTRRFVHHVAGIIENLKTDTDSRYSNLYFWSAEKILELLEASGQIKIPSPQYENYRITKTILLYSFFGAYFIIILSNSTIPSHFGILDARSLSPQVDVSLLEKIRNNVREVQSLEFLSVKQGETVGSNTSQRTESELETVAETQSSDSWFDYKPASKKYFVGRKEIQDDIFGWFESVQKNTTSKRIFYLDGKSGWGKSSLLNYIKAKTDNKHYKGRFYSLIVDSRSANSQNFIPLAFSMLVKKAVKDGFIPTTFENVRIESIYNVLQSGEVLGLLKHLAAQQKVLILVFDQFEDIFKRSNIFDGFYKLLIDAANLQGNICIGFSWKSEANIPIDHRAYFLWQQMRDFAFAFSLQEFEAIESKKIVAQLEDAIGVKLDSDFVRKLVDNSQGFPWLVKKLCVHIFNQHRKGISLAQLYIQDFNVEVLFREDCESLTPEELKALRYIAKKAYDNEMVDEIDVSDFIDNKVKESLLLTKRMIIKTGTKYNIYWDIFRDYLVTDQVPIVGETYILRQHPSTVYEIFALFSDKSEQTIQEVANNDLDSKSEKTYGNILRELRNLGLLIYDNEKFKVRSNEIAYDFENFKNYMKEKLSRHSFTIGLAKIADRDVEFDDVISVIKRTVKSEALSITTLQTYAKIFIAWLTMVDLHAIRLDPRVRSRAENSSSFTPQYGPKKILEYFSKLADHQAITSSDKGLLRALYDLKAYGLLQYSSSTVFLTVNGKQAKLDPSKTRRLLTEQSRKTAKIAFAEQVFGQGDGSMVAFSSGIEAMVDHINSDIYRTKTVHVLYEWAEFLRTNSVERGT